MFNSYAEISAHAPDYAGMSDASMDACREFESELRTDAIKLAVDVYRDEIPTLSHESALQDAFNAASDFVCDAKGRPDYWDEYLATYEINLEITKQQIMEAL